MLSITPVQSLILYHHLFFFFLNFITAETRFRKSEQLWTCLQSVCKSYSGITSISSVRKSSVGDSECVEEIGRNEAV